MCGTHVPELGIQGTVEIRSIEIRLNIRWLVGDGGMTEADLRLFPCSLHFTDIIHGLCKFQLLQSVACRWLVGDGGMTEADLRLFPTLFRFDPVYVARFLLSRTTIRDSCPALQVMACWPCWIRSSMWLAQCCWRHVTTATFQLSLHFKHTSYAMQESDC